jgi:branched-chain amino acid transport system ATP-binding protein
VAVNDVDFVVPEGSIVSLIGPNGAGKTTFFNMLTGVYKPTAGRIFFSDEDVTAKPPHAFTQRGIGRTFQNIRLFQNMTALENVMVGMHARLRGGILGSIVRTPRIRREEDGARRRARELLHYSGLRNKDEEIARNLSYGDQRRLEVARALATQPKLLLLDEVMTGLTPTEAQAGVQLVRDIRARGITILMVEHVMEIVMPLVDRVVVLNLGRVLVEGKPQEIVRNADVITAYLGEKYRAGVAASAAG